jgi:preprotein translocase subunit SecG
MPAAACAGQESGTPVLSSLPALVALTTTLNIAQILISITLVTLLVLQAKGSGFGASLGSNSSSVFKTKRGVEKTLFQLTVTLVIIFLLISLWSVKAAR